MPGRIWGIELNCSCNRGCTFANSCKLVGIYAVTDQFRANIAYWLEIGDGLDIVTSGLHINVGIGVLYGVGDHCHHGHRENNQAEHEQTQASTETMVKR